MFRELSVGKADQVRHAATDGLLEDALVGGRERAGRTNGGSNEQDLGCRGFPEYNRIEPPRYFAELPPEGRIGGRVVSDALVENSHQGQTGLLSSGSHFRQVL